MSRAVRLSRALAFTLMAGMAYWFALRFGTGGLWKGLGPAHAVAQGAKAPYDPTQLPAINETLKKIKEKYVDPTRVNPRQMLLGALTQVQREVAQVIVMHEGDSPSIKVRVDTEEREFRIDNVQGVWDVAARLREIFAFLQTNLKDTEVDLNEVEYAACNGILRTLDPHSNFLSPEQFEEMTLSTVGHFGGLGIVISVRDQMLTIMRPMPGTPAGRAGLKRLDRITKINHESTTNMPLDDAVKLLRGEPQSKVTIWVHRDGSDGWQGSRPFELTREEIQISSIDSRLLKPGIGYIRMKAFQANTDDELAAALNDLHKTEPLKGLVFDLRSNPGGLLDQAIRVADRFLDHGMIVAQVGGTDGRIEAKAQRRGTEPNYPIVILVNGFSASASEIVTGALKNQDRAIVVGQTTFGKGSVQNIFSNIAGGAALKLTIAQYLTPGDISIQGVGVTPDIELDPMTADPLEMDLFLSDKRMSEKELTKSLTHEAVRNTDRPSATLRYNLPESQREIMRDLDGDMEDEFHLDFPIKFATDLAAAMPQGGRPDQLKAIKGLIEKQQTAEVGTISQELTKLGVDWSLPPASEKEGPTSGQYSVTVNTDHPSNEAAAGEAMKLLVTVANNGTKPIYQLRAITKSDSSYYDERELIFGKIAPGQSKTAEAPLGYCKTKDRKPGSSEPVIEGAPRICQIPLDAFTRQDVIKVRFTAASGEVPSEAEIRPTLHSLPKPAFAYSYQVIDNRGGNGDGQIARGEGLTMYLDVKNTGKGASRETQARLRNLTGDGLLLHAGRFDISGMKPGDTQRVAFTFDVLDSLPDNLVKVELSVVDTDLQVVASEKLSLPVVKGGAFIKASPTSAVSTSARLQVREQPTPQGRIFAAIGPGAVLQRIGTFGDFSKVSLGEDRAGFVESSALTAANGPVNPLFEPLMRRSPPLLEVKPASMSTRSDSVRIEAVATDGDQVIDAFVFVNARKVFYQSNRKSTDPTRMSFSQPVNLNPGINVVTVVARESEDTATSSTMVVRRDGPNGESLTTPKTDPLDDEELSEE
ncbi:MAG TPA: MXAN_5808 family serine peptidase [Polyangiaceae bacterium]|nr:MXAN_5808 family serine peptidase [Polyangiaceae bacterium]